MKKIAVSFLIVLALTTIILIMKLQPNRSPSSTIPKSEQADTPLEIVRLPITSSNKKQIKGNILNTWDWHFKSDHLYISFENMDLKVENETTNFCLTFPQIEVVFEAPNLVYSGDHPEIVMPFSCKESIGRSIQLDLDFSFLKVNSDVQQIKSLIKTQLPNVRIINWDDEIPTRWRIKQINFSSEKSDEFGVMDLSKYEILGWLGHAIEFEILDMK